MTAPTASLEPEICDVRQVPGGVELDIALPESHFCFQGHFPGCPILPGVAQIDWAIMLADRYLGTSIGAACNFQVKFRSVIAPGRPVTLVLRAASERGRLLFEYRRGDDVLSSGAVRLENTA